MLTINFLEKKIKYKGEEQMIGQVQSKVKNGTIGRYYYFTDKIPQKDFDPYFNGSFQQNLIIALLLTNKLSNNDMKIEEYGRKLFYKKIINKKLSNDGRSWLYDIGIINNYIHDMDIRKYYSEIYKEALLSPIFWENIPKIFELTEEENKWIESICQLRKNKEKRENNKTTIEHIQELFLNSFLWRK